MSPSGGPILGDVANPTAELWTNWRQHRDERCFETLVRPELPHALGFARRLGCSLADAEDAVQDALARLVAVHDDSPMALGVRAWLCREVHVRARSRLRSERRRRSREQAAAVGDAVQVDSAFAVREEVERTLAELDEQARAAVQLRYLHDLDYREMAAVLGASEGACRKRVHKALVRLRARFGDDAAAAVAALPLAAVGDVSAMVRGAMAKAAITSAVSGGVAVMATTAQKVTIAALAAAALGVAGTVTVQRAIAPDGPVAPSTAAATSTPDARAAARPAARASDGTSSRELESLRARVAELEQELASAREKAADLDSMDPMAVLVYARKPIAWKARKLLDITDERARWSAMGKVGQVLAERETSGREFLDALKTETDPKVIEMIGLLVRGSLDKTPAEDRRAFVDLLRTAPLTETRAAASNALFMSEQFRGGFDDKVKTVAKEMNGYLIEALRTESSPDVVGAIALNLDAWIPPPDAMEALKAAAERLPPSPGRRNVWCAIARGMSLPRAEGMAALYQQFQAATAQDLKDDIAAGIARAGNSMSFGGGKAADARSRFLAIFGGTSDVAVRRSLLRSALYGFGCVEMSTLSTDEGKSDAARFFRDVSALEPDAAQRGRIEKVATAFEQKGGSAFSEFDKIMSAKD
jgi:RNA polymerase sigma factor (sigma-70 family)